MIVLGIETSCDECSVALVRDGKEILGHTIATQIEFHAPFNGVVPEIASRKHIEWMLPVYRETLKQAGMRDAGYEGIGVSNRPGLTGSLIVGLTFAKGLALSLDLPYIAVDHVLAHLYAPQLEHRIEYPFIGVLVSGGHSMICRVDSFDNVEVLGASIDDACGEAFDKVAKHLGLGYPGGKKIDELARVGDPRSYSFPKANLYKSGNPYDVSYSGLKNAVINQREQFWNGQSDKTIENICASFERAAIDTLMKKVETAVGNTGLSRVVAGGGVAANTYFRESLARLRGVEAYYPSLELCTDNGAMIAGIAYRYLVKGVTSTLRESVSARVQGFKRQS